ncbi:hypothetical protein BD311DRAFT_747596 [Dichomitus squalens]|uniref:Uncharacterized protein n=1 Tax=Dichomitus squalens TaxID=114155 RepID=A0A4Q9N2G3_9APHY|nr:hypothetical protein BD311DRAFT_747596 [Dichomitus squalens]
MSPICLPRLCPPFSSLIIAVPIAVILIVSARRVWLDVTPFLVLQPAQIRDLQVVNMILIAKACPLGSRKPFSS